MCIQKLWIISFDFFFSFMVNVYKISRWSFVCVCVCILYSVCFEIKPNYFWVGSARDGCHRCNEGNSFFLFSKNYFIQKWRHNLIEFFSNFSSSQVIFSSTHYMDRQLVHSVWWGEAYECWTMSNFWKLAPIFAHSRPSWGPMVRLNYKASWLWLKNSIRIIYILVIVRVS